MIDSPYMFRSPGHFPVSATKLLKGKICYNYITNCFWKKYRYTSTSKTLKQSSQFMV
jgi:hypothetical protein